VKCKCWTKITLFSIDYVSHSVLVEVLQQKGLNFIQDEKMLDLRLNLPCEDWHFLKNEVLQHVREGYGSVDIKCWGKDAAIFKKYEFIDSSTGYKYLVLPRIEKKEVKLRLMNNVSISHPKIRQGFSEIPLGKAASESAFQLPLSILTEILPKIAEEARRIENMKK